MNRLYTKHAAIKYLREQIGRMSERAFEEEVNQGRILEKPYGRSVRYRKEDLDRWQTITRTRHIDCSNGTAGGTRISRSSLLDGELSFAKLLAKQTSRARKTGA